MPESGKSMSNLIERIQLQTEQNRQAVDQMKVRLFDDLSENLRRSSANAFDITENAIVNHLKKLEGQVNTQCRIMSLAFGRKLIQALLTGIFLLIGIFIGGWGVTSFFQNEIIHIRQEVQELQENKNSLETTIAILQNKTWGIELIEDAQGRFVLLPVNTEPKTGWKVGKRQAVKVE